jgi:glutathione S-transferase
LKIYHAAASPFVRKCLVAATELGLRDRIELVSAAAHPVNRDKSVVARNPLGKIPTLITDDGNVLYDSRVICEYLNEQGDGHLIPRTTESRWAVLCEQALADGVMDAAVLTRYETFARPEALRWKDWITGQLEKVTSGLDALESRAADSVTALIWVRSPSAACWAISTSVSRRSAGETGVRMLPRGSSGLARAIRWQQPDPHRRFARDSGGRERGRAPRHPMAMNRNCKPSWL